MNIYCLTCREAVRPKEYTDEMTGSGRKIRKAKCPKCSCQCCRFLPRSHPPPPPPHHHPPPPPPPPPHHMPHGVDVPPHLYSLVVRRNGSIDKKKLKKLILEEHGLTGKAGGCDTKSCAGKGLRELASGVKTLATKGVAGALREAPPSYRKFIEAHADWIIIGAKVCRQPIKSYIDKALNFITLGSWEREKKNLGYDNLFHLYISLRIKKDRTVKDIFIEKNQRVRAGADKPIKSDTDFVVLSLPKRYTLAEFEANGRAKGGADFYRYDAKNNNCQVYALNLIEGNGLTAKDGSDVKKFVKQNVDSLMGSILHTISKGATDLAGVAQVLSEGSGIPKYADYLKIINRRSQK